MQGCWLCRYPEDDKFLVKWSMSLKALRQGASHGCQWCQFFRDSARLYENRWSHLTDDEASQARFKVWRDLIKATSAAPSIFLQWPSIASEQRPEVNSDIELGELADEVDLTEIELEFATEEPILEVSLMRI